MSGRIRSIKPEILEDAVTAGLSDAAFRLFVALIVLADDHGNFRAEPGYLRGLVYWRTEGTKPVDEALAELAPLVLFYVVHGQRYGSIRNWAKHQKISHKGKPRVPGPDLADAEVGQIPESLAKPSGESPATLGRVSGDPPAGLAKDSGDPPESLRSPAIEPETSSSESLRKPSGDPPESLRPDLRSPISDHGPPRGSPARPDVHAHARVESPPVPNFTEPEQPSGVHAIARVRPKHVRLEQQAYFVSAFERGCSRGLERRYALPPDDARTLDDAIDKHSGGLQGQALQAWVEERAEAYGRFLTGLPEAERRFWSGAKGFLRALNDDRLGDTTDSDAVEEYPPYVPPREFTPQERAEIDAYLAGHPAGVAHGS